MKCNNCGEPLPSDLLFCPCCGKEIDWKKIPPDPTPPKETRVLTARKKKDVRKRMPYKTRELILNGMATLMGLFALLTFMFPLISYRGAGYKGSASGFAVMFSDSGSISEAADDVTFILVLLWITFLASLVVFAATALLIYNRATNYGLFHYRNRNSHVVYSGVIVVIMDLLYLLFGVYLSKNVIIASSSPAYTASWWPLLIEAALICGYFMISKYTKAEKTGKRRTQPEAA